jgi:hypothetical protein
MQGTRRVWGEDLVFVRVCVCILGITRHLDLHMPHMLCFSLVLFNSPQLSTYTPYVASNPKRKERREKFKKKQKIPPKASG